MTPQRSRKVPSALTPASRKSLGEDVAERLREAILHGELSPGQRLREEELSVRLEVSRGPVRDAFILLEREGLVRSSRNRGVSVVELTRNDLQEIYTLRSALEPLAITGHPAGHQPLARWTRAGRMTALLPADASATQPPGRGFCGHHLPGRAPPAPVNAWGRSGCPPTGSCCPQRGQPRLAEGTVRGHTEILKIIRAGDENTAAGDHGAHLVRVRADPAELPHPSPRPQRQETGSPVPAPLAASKRIPL
jgi:DNA-binding GntR family transcriptional regulator